MEAACIDPSFGRMSYKHRWYKKQSILLFGKEWEITVAAKAYSGKPITTEQQKAYLDFEERKKEYVSVAEERLKEYVNSNIQDLAEDWVGARMVNNISDLAKMTTPKTLLFKQDGTIILLLECVWDIENGIAVKLYPEVAVGSQDLFL